MAIILKASSSNTVITGGWTNPTNAYDMESKSPATNATAEPAINSDIISEWGFVAFTDSEIPVGSTINSVTIYAEMAVATSVVGATLTLKGYNNGVVDSATGVGLGSGQTGYNRFNLVYSTTPSITDLKTTGRLTGRIDAGKGSTSGTAGYTVELVAIKVDFSPPVINNWQSINELIVGPNDGSSHTGRSGSIGTVNVGDVIVVGLSRSASSNDLASDTVTDSLSNIYTQIGLTYDSTNGQGDSLWYTISTSAGSCTITTAYASGASHNYDALVANVYRASSGTVTIDQSTHTGATSPSTSSGAGADTATTASVTTTGTNNLIVGYFANFGGAEPPLPGTSPNAFTPDAMAITQSPGNPGAEASMEHFVQASAGSITATASMQVTSIKYGAGLVTFKTSSIAATFLRPVSDITVGDWVPTPSSPTTLFDKLDETSASDADYITGTTTTEIKFG